LQQDEHVINQCKASNPKLIEFICQRSTLEKLIEFATMRPNDEDDHNRCHKYPFVAADVLASCKQITQALAEGGWVTKKPKEDSDTEGKKKNATDSSDDFDASKAENKMVQNILSNSKVSSCDKPFRRQRKAVPQTSNR